MHLLFFIIGICIGSFINVVIYRLPLIIQRESPIVSHTSFNIFNLLVPRSHCPRCEKTLGVLQLIPILSWLIQRGQCHNCRGNIPFHYPLIEMIIGLLFMMMNYCWPDPCISLPLSIFVSALLALGVIDTKHMILPDVITLPLIWLGILWNMTKYGLVSLESSVLGAVVGYLSLWSIYWLYRLLRNKEGLGYGDFKLMAALGAWLGISSINVLLLLGSLIGCAGCLLYRNHQRGSAIPFGPALIAAAYFMLLNHSPFLSDHLPYYLSSFFQW